MCDWVGADEKRPVLNKKKKKDNFWCGEVPRWDHRLLGVSQRGHEWSHGGGLSAMPGAARAQSLVGPPCLETTQKPTAA